jgi:hypothetical protein
MRRGPAGRPDPPALADAAAIGAGVMALDEHA